MTVRTLGVDLAAGDLGTAAAILEFENGCRLAGLWPSKVSDDLILELAGEVDVVAIDAPFGWPLQFAEHVAAYARGEPWPATKPEALWLRATDLRTLEATGGRAPLSVSSDRIARTAERAARLLTLLGSHGVAAPRDGSGRVVEVYPAAALRCWGIDPGRYKHLAHGLSDRMRVVELLDRALELGLTAVDRQSLAAADHGIDALVASAVGQAVSRGLATGPPDEEHAIAALEGWIWLPAGPLAGLRGAGGPAALARRRHSSSSSENQK